MSVLAVQPEVTAALAVARPVVALESGLVAHGLPRPQNLEVACRLEAAVRERGAVPATVAVIDGRVRVGLDRAQLTALATAEGVAKVTVRDLAPAAAGGRLGATTVAATAHVAARAGIGVFATGGLGGVHHGAGRSWDVSADLAALARAPVTVVCSGVKSIVDVAATLEVLETLGVTVLGYRTHAFAGFYVTDSGYRLEHRVDSPAEIAHIVQARADLGQQGALVVANPLPPSEQLDPDRHERVLAEALAAAAAAGVTGKAVTPFLLERFHSATGGASVAANVALLLGNATLAADIAVALPSRPVGP